MGEDVGKLGGVFRVTDGLQKDFGEQRVLDTPLAESGIIGTAIGLAIRGFRPVCEIQFDGFVFPGFDQIVSQLAKLHFRSQGKVPVPVVVRDPVRRRHRRGRAPQRVAGGVVRAHRGAEGGGLLEPGRRLLDDPAGDRCDDPVIFFEPKRRYWEKAEVDLDATPVPLFTLAGGARRHAPRRWSATGPMVQDVPGRRGGGRGRGPSTWRSSTCARCPRWTSPRCSTRCGGPAGWSSSPRRRRESSVAAEVAARVSRSASTRWRRRCCG